MSGRRVLSLFSRRDAAQHGSPSKCNRGCRCDECRRSHAEYQRKWRWESGRVRSERVEDNVEKIKCMRRNRMTLSEIAQRLGCSISRVASLHERKLTAVEFADGVEFEHGSALFRGGECTCYFGLPVKKLTGYRRNPYT